MMMSLLPATMTKDSSHSICSEENNAYIVDYQHVNCQCHATRGKAVTTAGVACVSLMVHFKPD